MGVLGNTIDSAMKQRDWRVNLKSAIQNYQDKQRDYEQEQVDRERVLAKTEFDYYGSLLSDPEKRLQMDDDMLGKLTQGYQSAADKLKATGLNIEAIDPDPIPKYIAATISQMQTDPKWRNVRPVDRYNYLTNKFGKHYFGIEASFINADTLQRLNQPDSPQVVNQKQIDKAKQVNQDKASVQLAKPGRLAPDGVGPVGDIEAVPEPIMTTPLSIAEKKGNEMFGAFYDGDVNPAVAKDILGKAIATLATMSPETHKAESIEDIVGTALKISKRIGAGLDEATIRAYIGSGIDPNAEAYNKLRLQNIKDDNFRQEENSIVDQIKESAAYYDTDIEALKATRPLRQRLFDLRVAAGREKAGPLPERYEFRGPTTRQQDRTYEFQLERALQQAGITQDRINIAMDNLRLQQDKFEWKQQNPTGSGAPDKYGRDPDAVEDALTKDEIGKATGIGFNRDARRHGPTRVRELLAAKNDPKSDWWKDSTGSNYETTRVLTKAGKARIDEINRTEEARSKMRTGNGASFGDKSPFVDSHGNKYGPDDCYKYVRNQLNADGVNVTNLRDLPKASGPARPGDVLLLDPRGGYKKPHWVRVNDDGVTVSEFQSKKTSEGKSQALGIRHDRTVSSLGSRIRQVYRPGGAKVTVRPERKGSNASGMIEAGNIDISNRKIINNPDGSYSTVNSFTMESDGKFYVVPGVNGQRKLTGDEAWEQFKRTGKHLGVFGSQQAADTYAENLHKSQAKQYGERAASTRPKGKKIVKAGTSATQIADRVEKQIMKQAGND
jgi:hypothetical protein